MDPQQARYICIHGHFYQPPRENPWLEDIEVQDSAYPYHDWNERITSECYAPNAASRILDPESKIVDITNNYAKISFNFGPTLLSWMQKKMPEIYDAVIASDRESMAHFSGHGSAIAQAYNHIIMPLADSRDKRTQVIWGIRDFEFRFGRKPEGMWLPETAVDLETLDILAEHGIRFTILAPRQASQVRKIATGPWRDVSGNRIDTTQPYLCRLGSGRSIILFFYDGLIAKEVAFGGLLANGENFAKRLMSPLEDDKPYPRIIHLAVDGETYGHHFRMADMALAYCIYYIQTKDFARISIYGEYLEKHPPTMEVRIFENTSWSCEHGIERWRSDCGCNTGSGRRQQWRAPLRNALNWLRDRLAPAYEEEMRRYADDPWKVRDAYIDVVLNREPDNVEAFFARNMRRELSRNEKVRVLSLLEMQRNAMFMFTSCGWFFDEISGIETTQILGYAGRAMQLAARELGIGLEPELMKMLESAPSNIPEFRNGARVYELFVKPARIDLYNVLAHFAVSSLFNNHSEKMQIYSYTAESKAYDRLEMGRIKLATGLTRIRSDVTWNCKEIGFAVLHLGEFHINGGANEMRDAESFELMSRQIKEVFQKNDIPGVIRLMDSHFRSHEFSLSSLFRDEQRNIVNAIMATTLQAVEGSFRQVYELNYPTMYMMAAMRNPIPKILIITAEFVLNRDLIQLLQMDYISPDELRKVVEEFKRLPVELDHSSFSIIAEASVLRKMKQLYENPFDLALWSRTEEIVRLLKLLDPGIVLWEAQNIFFRIAKARIVEAVQKAERGDAEAGEWIAHTIRLGNQLGVKLN
jgi:alpha-amylase/alpha-mannosidase (GH57 family)